VVDSHKRRRVRAFICAYFSVRYGFTRGLPVRMRYAGDRAQRAVKLADEPIHRRHFERLAEKKRAPEGARLECQPSG